MSSPVTRILFIDSDERYFQFRKCIAQVISELPPVELFHASDATEGLHLLEDVHPDVVVIDNNLVEERDLFMESLTSNHPPIVLEAEESKGNENKGDITYIQKNDSLEGIHQTLMIATAIAHRAHPESPETALH